MSEPEIRISEELRATAPAAPDEVRRAVLAIAARQGLGKQKRRMPWAGYRFGMRPALALGATAFLVLTLGATVVPRLIEDEASPPSVVARPPASDGLAQGATDERRRAMQQNSSKALSAVGLRASTGGTALPPARRLQNYQANIRLRVENAEDLSRKAQQAMRDARRMGGFVASVDFATEAEGGNATLVLRVPVMRIQEAVA